MKNVSIRGFDSRFSFITLAVVVLLSVTLWPTTKSKAVGKRIYGASSRQQIEVTKQQGKRVIQRLRNPNQPVEIIELSTHGKVTKLNKEIDVGDEWLDGLSWKIENISNKIILSIDLVVMLPDTEGPGQPILAFPMHYGANSPGARHHGTGQPLEPNDIIDMTISEELYRNIKPHIESRIPLKNLKNLQITLDLIVFNDDTAWSSGEYLRRDPDNPRRWIPIQ